MYRALKNAILVFVIASGFGLSSANLAFAEGEGVIDELRFGGSWTQPKWLPSENEEEDQVILTGEVLFAPFDWDFRENALPGLVRQMLTPRLHIGGVANLDKDGTSSIYTGLTWHFPIGNTLFLEGSFGAGINNGQLDKIEGSGRADLGSHILFRESVAVGINLTERTTFVIQMAHQSHAGLAGDENHGLTNIGAKLGLKF